MFAYFVTLVSLWRWEARNIARTLVVRLCLKAPTDVDARDDIFSSPRTRRSVKRSWLCSSASCMLMVKQSVSDTVETQFVATTAECIVQNIVAQDQQDQHSSDGCTQRHPLQLHYRSRCYLVLSAHFGMQNRMLTLN